MRIRIFTSLIVVLVAVTLLAGAAKPMTVKAAPSCPPCVLLPILTPGPTFPPILTPGPMLPPIPTPGPLPPTVPPPSSAQMVHEGDASIVSRYLVELTAGVPVTFETSALSAGSDPVLHLLERHFGTEVAVNDNGAGTRAARLTYQPSKTGKYWLVVRARMQDSAGTCDLLMNGILWRTGVQFAGWHIQLDNLRTKEEIETIRLPNGAGETHSLYILKADGLGIERYQRGGGIRGGAKYSANVALGTRWVIVAVPQNFTSGPARLVRNDVALSGHDPDDDGLGTELEAELGTCSSLTSFAKGFDCSLATDARDTDGDGIPDGWEVLGRRHVYETSPRVRLHEDVPLPLWGADPRHKDLFVEVDFMLRGPSEMPQMLSPAVAREFARYYQDEVGSVSDQRKAYHAATLRNPDGLPGVNVHLDTGVPPETLEDATLYGDWGGYTAVPPVEQPDGTWKGADFATAWQDHMSPARLGIFRYALPYSSGGGSVPINSFSFAAGINNAWVLAHESGHAMGLGHSGPPYATGDVDPNCKPNYPSLMNYAFDDGSVGFADGIGAPPLNNWSLTEWEAVPPSSTAYLDKLQNEFKYWVDQEHGHVDWNRDGFFTPARRAVRAYANFMPGGGGCEYTRYNRTRVPNAASAQAPAMARLGNRLYVFYSPLGALKYTYSTSSWDCPTPKKEGCSGGTWANSEWAYMDAQEGVDVVRIRAGDQAQLLVVTIDTDGHLWEARLSINPRGQEVWTTPQLIPNASLAAGEPSLARMSACEAYLTYKDTDGKVRFNHLTCASGWEWEGEQLALTPTNAEILIADYASPAISRAYLPWRPGLPALYGAFADTSGKLDIWWFNGGNGRWEKTDVLETRPGPIEGRPAMAWVPAQANAEYPGRFYLMYVSHDTDKSRSFKNKQRIIRMLMSYVKVTHTAGGDLQKTEKVGLNGPFDNVWHYAYGIDLLYESGIDTNLRYIRAAQGGNINFQLWFRPKADGINNFTYTNYNDWEVLRVGLCQNVVNPGDLVVDPIKCPDKTW